MGDLTHGWNKTSLGTWTYQDKCFGQTTIEVTPTNSTAPILRIDGWCFNTNTLQEVAEALLTLRAKIIDNELQ